MNTQERINKSREEALRLLRDDNDNSLSSASPSETSDNNNNNNNTTNNNNNNNFLPSPHQTPILTLDPHTPAPPSPSHTTTTSTTATTSMNFISPKRISEDRKFPSYSPHHMSANPPFKPSSTGSTHSAPKQQPRQPDPPTSSSLNSDTTVFTNSEIEILSKRLVNRGSFQTLKKLVAPSTAQVKKALCELLTRVQSRSGSVGSSSKALKRR